MCSLLAARVATWTAARQKVFSPGGSRRNVDRSPTECVLSCRLVSRRGPRPIFGAPLLKVYAVRVQLAVAPELIRCIQSPNRITNRPVASSTGVVGCHRNVSKVFSSKYGLEWLDATGMYPKYSLRLQISSLYSTEQVVCICVLLCGHTSLWFLMYPPPHMTRGCAAILACGLSLVVRLS